MRDSFPIRPLQVVNFLSSVCVCETSTRMAWHNPAFPIARSAPTWKLPVRTPYPQSVPTCALQPVAWMLQADLWQTLQHQNSQMWFDFTNDFIWANFSWNSAVHNVRRILQQSGCWMRRTKRRSRKSRISLARRSTFRVAHAQQQSPNTCRTWPAISRMKSNTVKHQHSVKWTRWPHTMAISKVKLSSPLAEACVYSAWFLATMRAQSKLEIHRLFEAPVWSSDLLKFVFTSNAATSGQLIFEPYDTNGELLLCTCHDTA